MAIIKTPVGDYATSDEVLYAPGREPLCVTLESLKKGDLVTCINGLWYSAQQGDLEVYVVQQDCCYEEDEISIGIIRRMKH